MGRGHARAVSERYVWIYTTEPKWWTEESPLGENLPEPYVVALERARETIALTCPRTTPSAPQEAMPGSVR